MAREMKDSGVEWIGKCPNNWKVNSAKYHIVIENGSDPKTEGSIPVYGSGTNSFKTCGEYKEGPAVLIGRKGSIENPRYIENRFWNVDTAFSVKVKKGFVLRFYYYLALSFDYKYYVSQTTLPSMTQTNYENMSIPVPSVEEQEHIASFLDTKCAEIDKAIEATKSSIEEYKKLRQVIITEAVTKGLDPNVEMKDSGVEWIGEMPKHWLRIKTKYVVNCIKSGDSNNNIQADVGEFPVFGGGALIGYTSNWNTEKSLLIGRVGAKCGCVTKTKEKAWATDNALIVEPKANIDWLFYSFKACNLHDLNTSNAQPLITASKVMNSVLTMPPKDELNQIILYLDIKCAEIDSLIKSKEKLIEELTAYRKSLIFEYVTGKKEVPAV